MDDPITSAEAARIAGVGTTAIKRWADSGALACVKTLGGHRRFVRQDVERFLRNRAAAGDEWTEWIDALTSGADVYLVIARIFQERARRGSWHAVADALGGLLTDIGRRWEQGTMSVLDEHLASAVLQRALAAVIDTVPVPPSAKRCLLASADGDDHTLGLSLVELCLREAGWRAEWLGSHTRAADVVARVRRGGVDMVAISAAASMADARALERLSATIGAACRAANIPLVLGGSGAWPEPPTNGSRFRDLPSFYGYLDSVQPARAGRPTRRQV